MSKPKFATIRQQAKRLVDMIPEKNESLQYLIDNYREAAEIFFAAGMYWQLYDLNENYPDVKSSFNTLKKVIEVYDSLPQDVYKIMKEDSLMPAVLFYCGRCAEFAIINQLDVVEEMEGNLEGFIHNLLSGDNKPEIEKSKMCGCYYCCRTFPASLIRHKHYRNFIVAAACPLCGMDSVIGDASGVPIKKKVLTEINNVMFG